MENTMNILQQVKSGLSITIGNWTFSKAGSKFKIINSTIPGERLVPERALQRILNNLL